MPARSYVLVHGAFRGGWAWDPLRALLEEAGDRVFAPSLTGMGDRAHLLPAGSDRVHLRTWVTDVTSLFSTHDLRDVVLVGHSQAGIVLAAASTELHSRIAELVFLDAPMPEDGERGVDLNPAGVAAPDTANIDLRASMPPRPVGPDDGFAPGAGEWVNARLCATPIAPSFERVVVSGEGALVPRRFAFFSQTPATYPCWSTRARLDDRGTDYEVIEGPHDTPFLHPERVASFLRS